jgi:hypothetical protein
MPKSYSCICGFKTDDLRAFKVHLLNAGEGQHKSARPTRKYRQAKTEESLDFAHIDNKPGVVTFKFKAEKIELNPTDIFEAYIIYNDLKTRHGIDNSFSDFLKAGSEIIWSLMQKPEVASAE